MQLGLRSNVLLMGDILEDADMVTDDEHSNVIRVGFTSDVNCEHPD